MPKLNHIFFLLILILFISCNLSESKVENNPFPPDWRYFGQAYPGSTPEIYSPGIISTQRHERDFAQSPAGYEIYYSYVLPAFNMSTILHLKHDGAFWSGVEVAWFSGRYNDLEPAISPDGNTLFFISKRPISKDDNTTDWNIWYVQRQDSGWSQPVAIDTSVNTEGNEYYPSVADNGNLYFTATHDEGFGGEDIYFSEFVNGQYSSPVNLGIGVNSSLPEFNAYVAPDEQFIIFSSYGRDDGFGGGDLYISFRNMEGEWEQSINLGSEINSEKIDYCPFVSPDQSFLFFTSERLNPLITNNLFKNIETMRQIEDQYSNGLGDIYWVAFDITKWKK